MSYGMHDSTSTGTRPHPPAAVPDPRAASAPPAARAAADALTVYRCPATHRAPLERSGYRLRCPVTGRTYRCDGGVDDFIGDDGNRPSPAQRLMESEIYALGYERVFRPRLTRLVTRQSIPDAMALHNAMLRLDGARVVLDVACGTGNFTRSIATAAPGALVLGLDRSRPMLERAAGLAAPGNVRWVRADALQLPLRDATVDRVHCAGALHLMPDVGQVLREWHRVLRPGGRVVVGTFVEASSARLQRLQRTSARWSGFRFFGRGTLDAALEAAAFEPVEEVIEGAALSFAAVRRS